MSAPRDHAMLALIKSNAGREGKVSEDVLTRIYMCLKSRLFDSDQTTAKSEIRKIIDSYISASEESLK